MAFVTRTDLNLDMHAEIIDNVTRQDSAKVDSDIETAIAEVDSYLNQKYDTTELWQQTGDNRNKLIKHLVIHVALWHICSLLDEIPPSVVDNYEHAEKLLDKIANGKIGINLPLLTDEEGEDLFIKHGTTSKRY